MQRFVIGRGNVAVGSKQAVVVEPPDPFEGGEFDIFETLPRSAGVDEFGTEIGRLGSAIFVAAKARQKCAGCIDWRRNRLPVDWVIVQDSTLGVVFTEPSGMFRSGGAYNGDVDLRALQGIHAVEVTALTIDVWGDLGKLVSITRIRPQEADSDWNYDPIWSDIGATAHIHQSSIMWISRVMYADRSIREIEFEKIAAAWLAHTGVDLEELPEPLVGVIGR